MSTQRIIVTPIEHDPDRGCADCPMRWMPVEYGRVEGPRCRARPWLMLHHCDELAPEQCPLRTGPVVVRAPKCARRKRERKCGRLREEGA